MGIEPLGKGDRTIWKDNCGGESDEAVWCNYVVVGMVMIGSERTINYGGSAIRNGNDAVWKVDVLGSDYSVD